MSGGRSGAAERSAEQWRSLHRQLLDLRAAIYGTGDEAERAKLLVDYHQKRDAIRALEQADAEGSGSGDAQPDEVTDDEVEEIATAVAEAAERARLIDLAAPTGDSDVNETLDEFGEGDVVDHEFEVVDQEDLRSDDEVAATGQHRSPLVMAMVAVGLFVCGIAIGYALAQYQNDDGRTAETITADAASSVTGQAVPTDDATIDESTASETNDGVAQAGTELDDAILVANLRSFGLSIDAVVSSEELATTFDDAITTAFGDRAMLTITVDESAPTEPWMSQLPSMVLQLPRLIEGSLTVGPNGTVLTGVAPTEASVGLLIENLESEGLPPLDSDAVIVTALEPSTLQVTAEDGTVTLDGTLPRQDLRQEIVAAVHQIDGINDIVDNISIDPNTYALFDVVDFGQVITAFTLDGSVEVSLLPGGFVARVQGLEFDSGGDELTPAAAASLSRVPPLLTRSTAKISIVGHTDDVGPAAGNQSLSERRASAVASYLVSSGVDPDRITIVGAGESEPVTANDTADGQARNRRVMVTMSFDQG